LNIDKEELKDFDKEFNYKAKQLETERLIIRKFKAEDYEDLYEYLSDEDVVLYEPYSAFSKEACIEEALNRANNEAFLAVCLKDSGKLIGNLYFQKGDFDTWELGYVFNKKYWGNGYATESAKKVIVNAIKEHNARRIIAMCNPKNNGSWKLLERLGMRREGHLIKNIYFKVDAKGQPIWADTYEYGILTSEIN
jgi:RimJ/RimL family protein N-acetyltransferase